MKDNPTVIVLGITSNWAFAAATVLLGLKKHLKDELYDIIIFHDKLSLEDQGNLRRIHACDFVQYDIELAGANKFARVSKMAFSRYECFGLLQRYENVIWLDADILIIDDLSELVHQCKTGFCMYLHDNIPISVSFSSPVDGYNMEAPCFNDGIFIINRQIGDGMAIKDWCYKHTEKYYNNINSDQAIINLLLQSHKLRVSQLDIRYNCHPENVLVDASIIHPWGTGKFWNHYWQKSWDEYYMQWINLGGSPCLGYYKFRMRKKFEHIGFPRLLKSFKRLIH